jgi:hypothetical protein
MSTYFLLSLSTTTTVLLFLFFLSLVSARQEPSLQRLRCEPSGAAVAGLTSLTIRPEKKATASGETSHTAASPAPAAAAAETEKKENLQ